MKEAMWGAGIMAFGLLILIIVNLFGNITVTNQFNYTTMKNAVEASMLDAVEQKYINGFCVCTDKDKVNGKYYFTTH